MEAKISLLLFMCSSPFWQSSKSFEHSVSSAGNALEVDGVNSPLRTLELQKQETEETISHHEKFALLDKLGLDSTATTEKGLYHKQWPIVTAPPIDFNYTSNFNVNIDDVMTKLVSLLAGEKVPKTWDEVWLLAKPNFQRITSYLDQEYGIFSVHETIPGHFLEEMLNFGDKMFLLKFLKSKLDDDFADFILEKIFKYVEPVGKLHKIYDYALKNPFRNSTDNSSSFLVSSLIEDYGNYLVNIIQKSNSLNQLPQFLDNFLPGTNDSADVKDLLLFSVNHVVNGKKLKRVERESRPLNRREGRAKYIKKDSGYDTGYGKGGGSKHSDGYGYDDGYGHDDGYGYDDGYDHDDGYGHSDGYGYDGYGHDSGYGKDHGDKHKGGYKSHDGYGHSSGGYGYGGGGYGGSGHGSSYGGGGYGGGHGGGYGGSHGGSYGPSHATIDPYVVLGALALGTLLAFLLYRIINGTGAAGREIPDHSFLLWLSDAPDVDEQPLHSDSLDRPERSVEASNSFEKAQGVIPAMDNLKQRIESSKYPTDDLNKMWRAYKLSEDDGAVRENLCHYLQSQATVDNLAGVDSIQSLIMASAGALLGVAHAGHLLDGEAYSRMALASPSLPLDTCSL